jgi:hypothetical protein
MTASETRPDRRPPVPDPAPGTDEDAAPQTQEFGHDGAEHYPTEDDPA